MDKIIARSSHRYHFLFTVLSVLALLSVILFTNYRASAESAAVATSEHIITVHVDGADVGFITKKSSLREALAEQGIRIDEKDLVEPSLDSKLVANSYQINIYRARPIAIHDGMVQTKVITAYQTPKQIAKVAGLTLHDQDIAKLSPSMNPLNDGAAEVMNIVRATPFTFEFYGKTQQAYTQATTIGDMLKEKGITLGPKDGVAPGVAELLREGMTVRLWRDGVQTVTREEAINFETKTVYDADQPIGYKQVRSEGAKGLRTVTYEINVDGGVEKSRKEINAVTTRQPVARELIVGVKPGAGGLTKGRGVVNSTDSKGDVHRETYYDLNMRVVMGNCGAGGHYEVRPDGVKIDKDGYIIIAANLALYPRCSLVETSLGIGRVYDTGGFVAHHPLGFDLATDWSNYDGI